MALNQEKIEILKCTLRTMAARYNQSTYGLQNAVCGTEQCMAGFCHLRDVGEEQFLKDIRDDSIASKALMSGIKNLGIENATPQIFASAASWPPDLAARYGKSRNRKEQAEVACEALDRMRPDGSIR